MKKFSYLALASARHQQKPTFLNISDHEEMIHSESDVFLIKNHIENYEITF